jgi:hypothetical protein
VTYADMLHEANVLVTRVSQLEQVMPPVQDTYVNMMTEAGVLAGRVSVLESALVPRQRQLVGGWRLRQSFSRGSFAIDFATMRCMVQGHGPSNTVVEFQLPQRGTGTNPSNWPQVQPSTAPRRFWPSDTYANGICFWQGKFWVSPRKHYDTAPPSNLTLFAADGETRVVNLPRQKFSGFVKRGPGLEPLLGSGGYESGQGSACGPTLGTLNGQVLINFNFGGNWDSREVRDPDYSTVGNTDSWVAYAPRNGQGRWGCDWISGGGLVLPEGICYWPQFGTGQLDYAYQSRCFARSWRNAKYVYDAETHRLKRTEAVPDVPGWFAVGGQEVDAAGRVYLSQESPEADVIIRVYE